MAAIQIPIELLALNAEFNRSVRGSTAEMKKLDIELKLANKDIKKISDSISFNNANKEIQATSKAASSLNSVLVKSAVLSAAFTVAIQKFGPALFGTTNVIKASGRAIQTFASVTTLASLKVFDLGSRLANTGNVFSKFGPLISRSGLFLAEFNASFLRFGKTLASTLSITKALNAGGLTRLSSLLQSIGGGLKTTAGDLSNTAKQTELFQKGVVGSTARVLAFGTGLTLLGGFLSNSENAIISFIGTTTELVGLLLGPAALAFTRLVAIAGGFIQKVGNDLVNANLNAAQSFADAELANFTFMRTVKNFSEIVGKDAIPSTKEWTLLIDELNESTGVQVATLQIAAAEISAIGSEIGLTSAQQEELLKQSVDYNAFIKGNLIQTTLDLLSGLQGNSQSVQKFGLNLRQAAVEAKLADKGIRTNLNTLSDSEKVQARLNVVASKYPKILGLAAAQTTTLKGTQELLNNEIVKLNTQYGRGTAIVESFAIGQRTLLGVIKGLNPFLVESAGFIGAIAGRSLQAIGLLLKLAFTVALVVTSIKALNFALGTSTFQKVFTKNIPILNRNLSQTIILMGATTGKIKSLSQLFQVMGQIFVFQSRRMVASLLGIQAATISTNTVMFGLGQRAGQLAKAFRVLAFNPLTIKLALLAAAGVAIFKVFQVIEQQTGLISRGFNFIKQQFEPLIDLFISSKGILTAFKKVFTLVLGALVVVTTKVFAGLALLIGKLPDLIVSADTKIKFTNAGRELNALSSKIIDVGFDVTKLGDQGAKAGRDLASGLTLGGQTTLPKELQSLSNQLDLIGKNDLQKLQIQQKKRLSIIQVALEKKKISEQQAGQLIAQVNNAFRIQEQNLEAQHRSKLVGIAARFGGAEAIAIQKAAELEQLMFAFEQELLTREEFELAKQSLEVGFEQRRLDAKVNNELMIADLTAKTQKESLINQQKILKAELANTKQGSIQQLVVAKRLQENKEKLRRIDLQEQDNFFNLAASLQNSGNKTFAAIGKSFALLQIAIKTPLAVVNSFEFGSRIGGPPLGFAFGAIAAAAMASQAAQVAGIGLQSGITQVPSGFPNDSFAARLTSGERVVNVAQNKDLTDFLANQQSGGSSEVPAILKEGFEMLISEMQQLNERIDNLENEIVVNIGNREVVREVREGLRAGRSLEA